MEEDWSVAYKALNKYQAEIIQGKLKEYNIHSIIINQKESAYMSYGYALIYVHNDNFKQAQQLIASVESKNPEED